VTRVQPIRDIAYGPQARNRLDLYHPAPGKVLPLVIYVHGGGFMMGDKANPDWGDLESIASMTGGGLAVASVNYRFSTTAPWPAQLDDLQQAVGFLRAGASGFGVDGARLGCFGPSAGGHLSVCLTLALAEHANRAAAPAPMACAAWFPPVDFLQMDADMEATGLTREGGRNDAPDSPESLLVGVPIRSDAARTRAATPLGLLDGLPPGTRLPPVFIQHGALDGLVAPRQSERLRDALVARGGECRLEILPDGTHGGGAFARPETMGRVTEFLRERLEG
jgi:acetyl esterase/lipase